MLPKPEYLRFHYAEDYQNKIVAASYKKRAPYPLETYAILMTLMNGEKKRVLDIGCGPGDIARQLALSVDHIDAIDASAEMIAVGKTLPAGDYPTLHWICGRVEERECTGPYELITAGESLHWMDWEQVLPYLQTLLSEGGFLALTHRWELPAAWTLALNRLILRYSTYKSYQSHNIVHELQSRHLFLPIGQKRTSPVDFQQSIDDYLTALHSRNGLSLTHLDAATALRFDQEVRTLLTPFAQQNILSLKIVGEVIWGTPLS